MKLIIPLLFFGVALLPIQADAKPLHGASECVRFYKGLAQDLDVPANWIGQKIRFNCTHE